MKDQQATQQASPAPAVDIPVQAEYPVPAPTASSQLPSVQSMVFDLAAYDQMERLAKLMASGRSTVPDHLKGNVADCFAIVMKAMQWKMDPFAVAEKTFQVGGKLGYEGQLVHAVLLNSGILDGRPTSRYFGEWGKVVGKFTIKESKPDPAKPNKKPGQYRVPAWTMQDEVGLGIVFSATIKGEADPREREVLLAEAQTRNSTLWATDPKQQLFYFATRVWARMNAPEVLLGVYTREELEAGLVDINEAPERAGKPAPRRQSSAAEVAQRNTQTVVIDANDEAKRERILADMEIKAEEGMEALAGAWNKLPPEDRKLMGSLPTSLRTKAMAADKAAGK